MAPVASDEFEGDDFSNNLFSDLAPLLTLFGEQVTKQFLSMSMGWADNVLLAMGPLGIITTIVSAIRVGGGKRLKALIGRARESHSVAEQELLSSTSQNVCEMWNGQQIVRLIGNPDEMETLVITHHGNVFDVQTALMEKFLMNYHDDRVTPAEIHANWTEGVSPNLALNARNATPPFRELWALAVLGTLLQFFSIAFAGMVTHYWKWAKSGAQVAEYGLPCFAAGTVCLMIAIMACGHVIEGITEENELIINKKAKENGARILCLQRARTLGDQHFPCCAIFMAEDSGMLKSSRLKGKNFKLLTTISTFLAISGYVTQFVGLRALHWSVTILQLGVALIMAAIRAWVRRGLASDPEYQPLLEGHELACLAVIAHACKSNVSNSSSLQEHSQTLVTNLDDASPMETRQPFCELTVYYSFVQYDWEWEFTVAARPLAAFMEFRCLEQGEESHDPLRIYSRLPKEIPRSHHENEIATVSDAFSTVLESLMNALDKPGMFTWTIEVPEQAPEATQTTEATEEAEEAEEAEATEVTEAEEQPTDRIESSFLSWGLNISNHRLGVNRGPVKGTVSFRMERSTSWRLLDRDLILALLSLSFHSLAARLWRLQQIWGQKNLSIGDENLFYIDNSTRGHPSCSGRIVGYVTRYETPHKKRTLEQWLDRQIKQTTVFIDDEDFPFFPGNGQIACHLGMFLSSASASHNSMYRAEELVIGTHRDSGILLQWAQELFSLFVLAIASKVETVLGHTREVAGKGGAATRRFENSVFEMMADEVVKGGLAHDRDEAYTLIIPAFAKYDLLPTCSTEQ